MVKRVLMTADAVGGVWTYALELSRALAAHGVEVVLATMGAPLSRAQHSQLDPLTNVRLYESSYKLEWMDDPWDDTAAAGEWLLKIETDTRPDVIHLNGYVHGALNWRAPILIVGHSCVLSWWRAVRKEDVPPAWLRYAAAVRSGLNSASAVIAPTRAMLNALHEHYGPFQRSFVIPNGRDSKLLAPAKKEEFVFAAGRLWDEAKNFRALDKAARCLEWPVHVAGQTNNAGRTMTFESVKLLGFLNESELAATLSRASVYALPARYEPFGLSVLEAAMCGCALVLGNIDSLRENWDGAALFVCPDDSDELCWGIQALISNSHERERLSAEALVRARSFSSDRMAQAYLQQYTSILSSTREIMEVAG